MEGMLLLLLISLLLLLIRAMIQLALMRYRQRAIYDFVTTFRNGLSSTTSVETAVQHTEHKEWSNIFWLIAILLFLLWLLPQTL